MMYNRLAGHSVCSFVTYEAGGPEKRSCSQSITCIVWRFIKFIWLTPPLPHCNPVFRHLQFWPRWRAFCFGFNPGRILCVVSAWPQRLSMSLLRLLRWRCHSTTKCACDRRAHSCRPPSPLPQARRQLQIMGRRHEGEYVFFRTALDK